MKEPSIPTGLITFTSDFGWGWGYVAACEGTMLRIHPQVRICHLSHDVPGGDVAAGALVLRRIAPLYPPAVHLAVVDPGVGTARRPLVLLTERTDALVGPDNGLLVSAAEAMGGIREVWVLSPAQVREAAGLPSDQISMTFHGRDVFAPAAALLAKGVEVAALGSRVEPADLVSLGSPYALVEDHSVTAEVIEVDRFGNVALAVRFAELSPLEHFYQVEALGEGLPVWTARTVTTFAELGSGELGLFCDSWGQVALALKSASAAQLLSLERGMRVRLTPLPQE